MLNEIWLLLSGLLILIGLLASRGLPVIIGAIVLVIWGVTKMWDRAAFQRVTHSRSLSRRHGFIGDSVEYTITLSNEKLLPLIWVEIHDTFPNGLDLPGASLRPGGSQTSRIHSIATSLLPYQRVSWKYRLRCRSRGYHRIGPVSLRSGDIFGFTSAETSFTEVEHLLVYPRIVELPDLFCLSNIPWENPGGIDPCTRTLLALWACETISLGTQ